MERENTGLRRKMEAMPRTGGYNTKPGAGTALANKKANTCRDW